MCLFIQMPVRVPVAQECRQFISKRAVSVVSKRLENIVEMFYLNS